MFIEKFVSIKFYFQIRINKLATAPTISRGFTSSAEVLSVMLCTAKYLFHIHSNFLWALYRSLNTIVA